MKNIFRKAACIAAISAISGLCANAIAASAPKLPSYQVDLNQTSVSGLSSGAYMAGQFQVAYSSIVVGAGIIAGGPYYCAGSGSQRFTSYTTTALTTCMNPSDTLPNGEVLAEQAKKFARSGEIDDLSNLKREKIYLFSGKDDHVVATKVVDQTAAFYKKAGVPLENIKYINNVAAGHAIITGNNQDVACALTAAPYINDCDFTQSHEILKHIYGNLNPPVTTPSGNLIKFDQDEFDRSFFSSMSNAAYAYVPKSCETETCKVHVAFHGCAQGTSDIGNRFIETTGYNEIADSNNIIVLYPQLQRSAFFPFNPQGCWDFWGYSSTNPFLPNFYTKRAPQISAVRAMLNRLAEPRRNNSE